MFALLCLLSHVGVVAAALQTSAGKSFSAFLLKEFTHITSSHPLFLPITLAGTSTIVLSKRRCVKRCTKGGWGLQREYTLNIDVIEATLVVEEDDNGQDHRVMITKTTRSASGMKKPIAGDP